MQCQFRHFDKPIGLHTFAACHPVLKEGYQLVLYMENSMEIGSLFPVARILLLALSLPALAVVLSHYRAVLALQKTLPLYSIVMMLFLLLLSGPPLCYADLCGNPSGGS
jgi:hypothetical protein